jgi:DNA replication licensing factor MCM4
LSADPNAPLYPEYLRKMRLTGDTGLNLDVVNLLAYPPAEKLWWQLQKYPQEVIPAMDQALKDLMVMLAEEDDERDEVVMGVEQAVYKVRPLGYNAINMRDLNPSSTDQIITVKGLVIRATPIIPDMREGKKSSKDTRYLLTLTHSLLQMC